MYLSANVTALHKHGIKISLLTAGLLAYFELEAVREAIIKVGVKSILFFNSLISDHQQIPMQ